MPAVLLAIVAATAVTAAQMPRWLSGGGEAYQVFRAPGDRFTLEYPKQDWQTLSGAGTVYVVFSHKRGEASVSVEHTLLKQALEPREITELFADLELEQVKARYAGAQDFRTALYTDAMGQRIVVIDFKRPGVTGAEHVRQFSLPIGVDLFRLICAGKPATFDKYIPVFERMVETFKNGAAKSGTSP